MTDGFLEVSNNVATLLADAVESHTEIDIERARAAYDRAWSSLKAYAQGDQSVDLAATRAALRRAANRMKVAEAYDR